MDKHLEALSTRACPLCSQQTVRFLELTSACNAVDCFQCTTCNYIWTKPTTDSYAPQKGEQRSGPIFRSRAS